MSDRKQVLGHTIRLAGVLCALLALAATSGTPTASAVTAIERTSYGTLLRSLTLEGDPEFEERVSQAGGRGVTFARALETDGGRATGDVTASIELEGRSFLTPPPRDGGGGGGGDGGVEPLPQVEAWDRVAGRVQVRTTGDWAPLPAQYNESRASYAISFRVTEPTYLHLSGQLDATQTSQSRIVLETAGIPDYARPLDLSDDPDGFRNINRFTPPDVKTVAETLVLQPLPNEGIYHLRFIAEGVPFRDLFQDAGLDVTYSLVPIPEPGTALLLGLGLGVLATRRGRTPGP